jgi:hypothetical protein
MTAAQEGDRPAATNVPDWVTEHYRLVDAAQLDTYLEDFHPQVEVRFANNPPAHGREAARAGLAAGHAHHDMRHKIVGYYEDGQTSVIEFLVHYTYRDGRQFTVPSCAVIHRDEAGLYDFVRIYLDLPD